MLSVTSTQLEAWLAAFWWPFLRIVAFLLAEPLLGHRAIPLRTRVALAMLLTVLLAGSLPPMPQVPVASSAGLLVAAQQMAIGFALGFTLRLVLAAVELSGVLGGQMMGLGFATFYDPTNAAQVPALGQFLGLLALLVFFAMNGHLMAITVLAESFRILPPGTPLSAGGWRGLALLGGHIFTLGLLLSLPIVATLLLVNVALGIASRAAPQLNLFAVGFPVALAAGFVVLLLALPALAPHFLRLYEAGVRDALDLLVLLAGRS